VYSTYVDSPFEVYPTFLGTLFSCLSSFNALISLTDSSKCGAVA